MATSAYQVEGGVHEGGRGPSIWDTFSHSPGRTRHGDTGDIACDQFHRFEEDVALMSRLGIQAYRFSVAWPRVQPDGVGRPNQRGLDHYRRLVDRLRGQDIAPVATLYHWDLPQALEDVGGWRDRATAERFAEYASIVHEALAGDVALWITMNEPWVAAWLGYGSGEHAPGGIDPAHALAASHHLLLAHGLAADRLRSGQTRPKVGITLNLHAVRPASDARDDAEAARRADLHFNRQYLDPVFGRGYPGDLVDHYASVSDFGFVRDGDLQAIARPLDFLGVNYYTRHTVTAHPIPEHRANAVAGGIGAWSFVPPSIEASAMGWAIEPDGLTELLVRLDREYPRIPLYITENGVAVDDYADPEGGVDDEERIDYLRTHLRAAHEAIAAGVSLAGYFVWSLLDNFEWAEGYGKRFGIVHVHFPTQTRTPKRSALWYQEVISRGAITS